MLITKKFIMLNFPKTGSSFARKVLKHIFSVAHTVESFDSDKGYTGDGVVEHLLPNIRVKGMGDRVDHHGTYSQIPESERAKPVFSIGRDPILRLLSLYRYQFWVQRPPMPIMTIKSMFPMFPNLSLREYFELTQAAIPYRVGFKMGFRGIGPQSVQFVQMFFKQPEKVLRNMSERYIDSSNLFEDVGQIQFLRQEKLRCDLKRMLELFGLPKEKLTCIDTFPNSNVSEHSLTSDMCAIDDELRITVIRHERLMQRVLDKFTLMDDDKT